MTPILDLFTREKQLIEGINSADAQIAHYKSRIEELKTTTDPALKARSVGISVYEKMITQNKLKRDKLVEEFNTVEDKIKAYFAQFV